ncbi:MAG: DDE-type integrase/transposase/recombinase, partial [Dermatophilaceae bacterium]|nr:DDE-type integrase/transposase/recombinase [Dermatophilaceae bacterium]
MVNRVWVGDITYLRAWEGWLYLATVIDAHSRRVVGWAIAEHMRADLVEQALQMAITLRGELPAKVVFHADRGTQYASTSTPRPRSPPSPPPTASPAPWGGPGCAGTTPWPNRCSPP